MGGSGQDLCIVLYITIVSSLPPPTVSKLYNSSTYDFYPSTLIS